MIDPELDDGFTFDVDGKPCRPLLHDDPIRDSRHLRMLLFDKCFFRQQATPAMLQCIAEYDLAKEKKDFQDLNDSIEMHVLYNPGLSMLDCMNCQQFAVDHSTGEVQYGPDEKPKRIPGGVKVPCETARGCLKRHHTDPLGLSNPRWAKTWNHYWAYRNSDHRLMNDLIFQRNKLLIDWIVEYDRDRRFDPFIGRSSRRRRPDDSAQGTAGPCSDRKSCTGGSCSAGACSTERQGKHRTDGDGGTTRAEPVPNYYWRSKQIQLPTAFVGSDREPDSADPVGRPNCQGYATAADDRSDSRSEDGYAEHGHAGHGDGS